MSVCVCGYLCVNATHEEPALLKENDDMCEGFDCVHVCVCVFVCVCVCNYLCVRHT